MARRTFVSLVVLHTLKGPCYRNSPSVFDSFLVTHTPVLSCVQNPLKPRITIQSAQQSRALRIRSISEVERPAGRWIPQHRPSRRLTQHTRTLRILHLRIRSKSHPHNPPPRPRVAAMPRRSIAHQMTSPRKKRRPALLAQGAGEKRILLMYCNSGSPF